MKPVIFFRHKKNLWSKIGISVLAAGLILIGVYFVYLISYGTFLLYRCKKYVIQKYGMHKMLSAVELQKIPLLKKNIDNYQLLKKKYEKRRHNARQMLHWYMLIIKAISDQTILEKITMSKSEINCLVTTPNMESLHVLTEKLLKQPDFAQVIIQSYQKTADGTIASSLLIIPKKYSIITKK